MQALFEKAFSPADAVEIAPVGVGSLAIYELCSDYTLLLELHSSCCYKCKAHVQTAPREPSPRSPGQPSLLLALSTKMQASAGCTRSG